MLFETVYLSINLTMTAVKNVNIDEFALAIAKVLFDLNEYDLLQLTKRFNLYNDNLASKGKKYLRKMFEKYYEGILDDDDLLEDVKKQELQNILAEVTPNEEKSITDFANQQHQHGVSRTPPVISDADISEVEGNNQLNFLKKLGILNPLRKNLKKRGTKLFLRTLKRGIRRLFIVQEIKHLLRTKKCL